MTAIADAYRNNGLFHQAVVAVLPYNVLYGENQQVTPNQLLTVAQYLQRSYRFSLSEMFLFDSLWGEYERLTATVYNPVMAAAIAAHCKLCHKEKCGQYQGGN